MNKSILEAEQIEKRFYEEMNSNIDLINKLSRSLKLENCTSINELLEMSKTLHRLKKETNCLSERIEYIAVTLIENEIQNKYFF